MFGIKWTEGCGYNKQLLSTQEFYGGSYHTVQANFRAYNTLGDSLIDHSKILLLSRYNPVRQAKNYKEACTQIQQCGYATSPTYTENLIKIIEQNNLQEFDKGDDTLKNLVTYFGDGDLLAAVIVSQKLKCPVMNKADYDGSGIKADNVIQIGGKPNSDRYTSFKDAANLI